MNLIKQLVYVKLDFIFYDYNNDIDGFIDTFYHLQLYWR